MDDNTLTIVLIFVAVVVAGGVGFIIGADIGYRRGWLFGERSAAKRTLRQIQFAEEQVQKVLARERRTIERVYGGHAEELEAVS
jgi:hypothetical protein